MLKKLTALLLALVLACSSAFAEGWSLFDSFFNPYVEYYNDTPYYEGCFYDWFGDSEYLPYIEEDGLFYSVEDVSLYLVTYGWLPLNFITKSDARSLGWSGGSMEDYLEGAAIGGDTFGNRERLLPAEKGRVYYECDINTDGRKSRGAERLVFSSDGLIYYTNDHYESFVLIFWGLAE